MELSKTQKISVGQTVSYAWMALKKNFKFLLFSVIIFTAITWGYSLIQNLAVGNAVNRSVTQNIFGFVLTIIQVIIDLLLIIGFARITLSIIEGRIPKYTYLWDNWGIKVWNLFVGLIIMCLAVAVGLLLFIVPGIILLVKLQYFIYFIVEKDMGVIESLKASWNMTQNHVWKLFMIELVIGGTIILGFIAFIIMLLIGTRFGEIGTIIFGVAALVVLLLIDYPFTFLIHTYVYKKLSGGKITAPHSAAM
jgi:uncharacterized membrane protein